MKDAARLFLVTSNVQLQLLINSYDLDIHMLIPP